MASKGGGGGGASDRAILIPLALLSAFLFFQAFGMLPTSVTDDIVRWAGCAVFLVAAAIFAKGGTAVWCGLCAAMAVVLNPLYPLDLGGVFFGAKILGGAIAGAAVVRNW